jgi:hypothetical protein
VLATVFPENNQQIIATVAENMEKSVGRIMGE